MNIATISTVGKVTAGATLGVVSQPSQTAIITGIFAIIILVVQFGLAVWLRKLERSMNHMRDEIVLRTAESSLAEGKEKGIAQEKSEQALRDAGAAKTKVEP